MASINAIVTFWLLDNINLKSTFLNQGRSRSSRNGPMPSTPMGLPQSTQSELSKRSIPPHPQVPVNTQFNTVSGSIAAGVAPPVAAAATGKNKTKVI